jgi:hypothetical protein
MYVFLGALSNLDIFARKIVNDKKLGLAKKREKIIKAHHSVLIVLLKQFNVCGEAKRLPVRALCRLPY